MCDTKAHGGVGVLCSDGGERVSERKEDRVGKVRCKVKNTRGKTQKGFKSRKMTTVVYSYLFVAAQ
jgi:hypothetical protein